MKVVGVRFKKTGKIYYFDPGQGDYGVGETVIVETARGVEIGEIVINKDLLEEELVMPLKQVLRRAGVEDMDTLADNKEREKQALTICRDKVRKHDLPMKLIDAEFSYDGSKITFYFTADGRVDFRELVRDLAAVFRTRIELRQIGVRDEAKILGGMGSCGRVLCCASFMGEFDPVSIRMAKEQNLSLNPGKISGICGRLMCCLRYENDVYEEARKAFPAIGSVVETEFGDGKLVGRNVLEAMFTVEFPDNRVVKVPKSEVKVKCGGK